MQATRFLITGVGGQGTILASDVLAEVGLRLGYDAKKSDILGLAVRGGSVVSHIIWGGKVRAPMIDEGSADYYISFEWLEGLRRMAYTNPDTVILLRGGNLRQHFGGGQVTGKATHPGRAEHAAHPAASLGGKALGPAVLILHENRFHAFPVRKFKHRVLHAAADSGGRRISAADVVIHEEGVEIAFVLCQR